MRLDAGRLSDLRIFSPTELEEIGRNAIEAVSEQLDVLERALVDEDLPAIREAAHRARNETLLVGARELGEALVSVEEAVRAGDGERANRAAAAARSLWPPTREAIARATYRGTG